jgi:hypothetical protein
MMWPYELEAADRVFFEEHGWWVSPPIVPDDVLEALSFGIKRYLAGERDRQLWAGIAADMAFSKPVRQEDYVSLQIDEVREFVRHPLLPGIAAQLIGAHAIRLFHDQLVTKRARTAESVVGWHTDRAYWRSCSSERMLTAWVPLQDVDQNSGALTVLDGSHKWPDAEVRQGFHSTVFDDRANQAICLQMTRGAVSFHHCNLVHGSPANHSDQPRIALSIHYQDETNRWRPLDVKGREVGHVSDLLCKRDGKGQPNYLDPDVFPLLWPHER